MCCWSPAHARHSEQVDDAISASGGKATLIPLDLTDGKRVDALGPTLYERFGRLDVLVGNAAILGRLSPLTHIRPSIGSASSPSTSPPIGG